MMILTCFFFETPLKLRALCQGFGWEAWREETTRTPSGG